MKVLVTGFQPFGGESMNPAYEAVKLLPQQIDGVTIIKKEIPVVFNEGADVVRRAIKDEQPDIVICVGQAGGRVGITPEFVGINYADARIPDNAGNAPMNQSIKPDGENAYFTTLPVKAMVTAMKNAEIPAAISYTAGTYVCNDVMYQLLYYINTEFTDQKCNGDGPPPNTPPQQLTSPQQLASLQSTTLPQQPTHLTPIRGGFIHVPFCDEQVVDKPGMPSLPLTTIAKGLELCIKAAIHNETDIQEIGGTIQ